MGDYQPEIIYERAESSKSIRAMSAPSRLLNESTATHLVTVRDGLDLPVIAAFRLLAARLDERHPILLKDIASSGPRAANRLSPHAAYRGTNIGSLLCDGIGDAILVQGEEAPGQALRLAYNILQAAGSAHLQDRLRRLPELRPHALQPAETTARIKAATAHLKGVKIAIMGCIVNGPGEMADADFGYVGGAPGKINLYVGKTAVKFNIPQGEAVDRLKDLISEHGKWVEPVGSEAVAS